MDDLTGLGKSAESFERLTREIRKLSYDFISPPLQQTSLYIADKIRFMRWQNALTTLEQAKEKLKKHGREPAAVQLKLIVPLLESSSLEDSEYMISKWSFLLANATLEKSIHPAFIQILNEMSPCDVQTCEAIYEQWKPTWGGFDGALISSLEIKSKSSRGLLFHLENLKRMGLIYRSMSKHAFVFDPPLGQEEDRIQLTHLGLDFIRACREENLQKSPNEKVQ